MTGDPVSSRSTARNIAWNYVGFACQVAINFGLTWYFTRRLAVSEYGLFLFVISLSSGFYLLDLGLSSVLVQALSEARTRAEISGFNRLLGTAFVALAALGTCAAAILIIVAAVLPGPFNIPSALVHDASIIFVLAGLMLQVEFPAIALHQAFEASHRFDRVNQIQLVCSAVQAVLSIALLMAGYGIVGLAEALLASSALRLLLLAAVLPVAVPGSRLSARSFDWQILKPLVHLSKWAFFQNLGGAAFELGVWAILGSMGSMREAAMFGLAGKIPAQLRNLVDRGASVALPLLSNCAAAGDEPGVKNIFFRFQRLVFGAVIPFVVFGAFAAGPIIHFWAGDSYSAASAVLRWLLLAAFGHALAYTSDLLLFARRAVKRAAIISTVTGLVSLAGAVLLVSGQGAVGLAIALAFAQVVVNLAWFTAAACKLVRIPVAKLIRQLLTGMTWPLTALAAELALLFALSARLSSSALLAASIAGGCVYLVVWASAAALPLYRGRSGSPL